MIEGVIVQELRKITDERGSVMHMLRSDSELFRKFGEIYFSQVNPNVVKAWKKHDRMTQNFAVPVGKIKLVVYDARGDSMTYGAVETFELGEDRYLLIRIPPSVWYGFQCISKNAALIANCTDIPHDPQETVGLDMLNPIVPYKW